MDGAMNEMLVERIRSVSQSENPSLRDVETGLAQVFEELGTPLSVQAARDGFSGVLRKARDGKVQVVGRRSEEMTLVISIKELAAFILAASKPPTFGDALDAAGFRPVEHRAVLREGRPREPLVRYTGHDRAEQA